MNSPVAGSVWQVLVREDDEVEAGQTLAVVESMKMEFPVLAPSAGKVLRVQCRQGSGVSAGQAMLTLC